MRNLEEMILQFWSKCLENVEKIRMFEKILAQLRKN